MAEAANDLKDEEWPERFLDIWGKDRFAVIQYLRGVYMAMTKTYFQEETTNDTILREAEIVLAWWWEVQYGAKHTREINDYPDEFGYHLLARYRESKRVDPIDNVGSGRF